MRSLEYAGQELMPKALEEIIGMKCWLTHVNQ